LDNFAEIVKRMDFQDYYKILGIERQADQDAIKKAYRLLALKYHPDKNPQNPKAHEQFIKIQEAYEVLKDSDKKKKYDQLFDIRNRAQNSYQKADYTRYTSSEYTHGENSDTTTEQDDSGIFSSFFRHFFSRKKNKYDFGDLYKGKDLKGNISIDLEEAFLGAIKIITVNSEKLRIKIKPGVKNNQVIRIKGKGAYGEIGTNRGDLILTIMIKPNLLFKRKENDLYREINVNIFTAILGGRVQFETMHGSVIANIPEGSPSGSQIRIKGKGMPKYSKPDEFGDLYVKLHHKMPTNLSDEEKTLLTRLKEINSLKK
jgi:curved DNA-binding protein